MANSLSRARDILRDQGVVGYLTRVKRKLYQYPLIDQSWYLLNRYLRPGQSCVKTVQGSKMRLDLADPGISRDLFLYGMREPESTKIYRDMIAPGMNVVDVGANVGYYVLIEAKVLGDTGKIYAIEPAPANFERLTANLELNRLGSNIESHNMAISDRVGKVSFELADASNHCRLSTNGRKGNTIEIEGTTLDALIDGRDIDVVRMDTEGSEWVILQGMREILARGKPLKMFIEVHPRLIKEYHGSLDEWLRMLADNDFRVTYVAMWEPDSEVVIPYIKGRGPREYTIRYDRPLAELLQDDEAAEALLCRSGHAFGAGYKLFLER